MPIREYLCPEGHRSEELLFGEAPGSQPCPFCESEATLVRFSQTGLHKVKGGTPRFHKQPHRTDVDHRAWSEKAK
jgi:hypothetical protein